MTRSVALSALALVLAVVGACSSQTETEVLALAQRQLAARDVATAIVTVKQALQRNERFAGARHLLGQALLASGDAKGAALELRKALALGHDADQTLPLLVRALIASGEHRAAIGEWGDKRLTLPRAEAELAALLAQAHAALDESKAAAEALQRALASDPGYAPAQLLNARWVADAGRPDEALAIVARVIEQQPALPDAWVLRGDILAVARQDRAGAAQAYRQSVQIDGRHLPALVALANLALAGADPAQAEAQVSALHKAWPGHPRTLEMQARQALKESRWTAAREYCQQWLRLQGEDVRALTLAGEVEWRAGARLPAQALLKKALGLAPNSVAVRVLLAQTQIADGDAAAATKTLAPVVAAAGASAAVLGLAADAQLKLGDAVAAQALYQRANKTDPADPRWPTGALLAGIALGDGGKSLSLLEALGRSDASGTADFALAQTHAARGEYPAALKALASAERKQPKNPLGPLLRGQVHERLGDPARARAGYEQALALDRLQPDALRALGLRDVAEGRAPDALARLAATIESNPTAARLRLLQAELLDRSGAPAPEVQASLEAAQRASPTESVAVLALIGHQLRRGLAQAALTTARTALTSFPADLALLDALGQAEIAAGEPQQAINSFKKLVAASPRQAAPLLMLAQAYRAAGETASARSTLDQVLAIDPASAPAHKQRLDLALADQQWPQALLIAQQQQQRAPAVADGWLWEASVHAAQRRWDPAVAAVRAALARGGGTAAATALIHVLVEAGQRAEADRHTQAWLAQHPKDAAFRTQVGQRAAAAGDFSTAEVRFREVLALKPNDAPSINDLAYALARLGRPEALQLAERASRLDPERPEFLDTWAAALAANRQFGKAVELQQQVVGKAPKHVPYRLHLASLALQQGERRLARETLEPLEALGSKLAQADEVARLLKQAR